MFSFDKWDNLIYIDISHLAIFGGSMKFQLTCLIDADLIGPLTELIAPYSRVSIKLVEGEGPVKMVPPQYKKGGSHALVLNKRRSPPFMPEKGLGTVTVLRAVAKEASVQMIKEALKDQNLEPAGSSATLSKLKHRGYVKHLEKGVWRLTPKGESALRRVEGVKTEAHEVIDESVNS
jgi:predicted transcriptional regulator